ncbi:MAG: glycerate kinase [candidate division WOR-3 bacterium]|nr:glycerate kinase [candidate division WOR-3 bacterium]
MKILIASGSFKGSINSLAACQAIARGIKKSGADVSIIETPIADGGTGTAIVLTGYLQGKIATCRVQGPIFRKVDAEYGIIPERKIAIVELAQAAGLHLVPQHLRNPLKTTTLGVGEIIKNLIKRKYKKIILGVGDSATIDCGIGAMSALGIRFLDRNLRPIEPTCLGLINLYQIDDTVVRKLKDLELTILVDVKNRLTGKSGAIVYAPQKGATKKELPLIMRALKNFKKIVYNQYKIDLDKINGAGAAGGIAGGMYAILGARITPGFDFLKKTFNISEKIKNADCVITGEGKIDQTTFRGKATGRLLEMARKCGKPLILICGDYERDLNFKNYDVVKLYSLTRIAKNREHAIRDAEKILERIGMDIGKTLACRLKSQNQFHCKIKNLQFAFDD